MFMGVPQPKPLHRFSPNFQDICLSQEDLEMIMFWRYPVPTVAMATLLNFGVLKFLLKSLIYSVTKILKLASSDLHKM